MTQDKRRDHAILRTLPDNPRRIVFGSACLAIACFGSVAALRADQSDALARDASWSAPTTAEVAEVVLPWLESQGMEPTESTVHSWLTAGEPLPPAELHRRVLQAVASVDPRVEELLKTCERPRSARELAEYPVLGDTKLPDWVRANLRLHYGAWLANQQLYDECHDQLSGLTTVDVMDPAKLLFYQAVAAHRRLEKPVAQSSLNTLLENESTIPRRYAKLAQLMLADLEPLKPDSLDEVARLMDSIQVRLGHGRAGKRVRKEEDDVIAKLDKMIEELEKQASQSQSAASAGGGSMAPSSPMEDSMPAGGTGPGNVDPKKLGADTDWGNLPPQEREKALQELNKDLPSHYREVIEEYFRKLAREQD